MGASIGASQPTPGATLRRPVVKRMAQILGQLIVTAAILFGSAGDPSWTWGWAFVGVTLIALIGVMALMLPGHSEVVAERTQIGKDTKSWDLRLSVLMVIPAAGIYVVAGLDKRFGWTPEWPVAMHVIAAVVFLLSYALAGWAMSVNRFFATTVRIQKERGHTVVTNGPYRFVRHPGYVSYILTNAAVAVLLGSAWALIPAAAADALMVVRTILEDRTLQAELLGYKEYMLKTRYRLIPGVW